MNSHHLRKTEIQYELKIRGQPFDGSANDLRKRLTQCFSSNIGVVEDIVQTLEPETELEECEEKFNDLSTWVEDYDGSGKDTEGQRLLARLGHLSMRIDRIPTEASGDEDLEERKSGLFNKTKALVDLVTGKGKGTINEQLSDSDEDKKTEEGGSMAEKKEEEASTVRKKEAEVHLLATNAASTSTPHTAENMEQSTHKIQPAQYQGPTQPISRTSATRKPTINSSLPSQDKNRTKAIPVYKWGLRFDNEHGQSVGAFLQRVEELRRARGVTQEELFDSAVDLFTGSALVWYRSTIGRITSWESLCVEMKIVFQAADHDVRLQQEIFTRVQGENESIDLFIACMEGLYGRLAVSVPEETRLKQILHNLHPQLQDRLALFEVTNIEELRLLGRKAEMGRRRAANLRPTYTNKTSLEPDLSCNNSSQQKRFLSGKVATIHSKHSPRQTVKCWNCNNQGHRFATCTEPRTLFCYGCGTRNTKKSTCPHCNPTKNM